VVPTYNADWRLERCLSSLGYADEIVIVDMCSTNDTVARARAFTDRIFVRDGNGDINGNINFGFAQARHEYLHLAPQDHVIPGDLATELRAFANEGTADVVEFEQRTFKFGREIRYGSADERFVMFFARKGSLTLPEGALHKGPQPAAGAKIARARASVLHNSDVRISDWLAKQNRFTDIDVGKLGFAHFDDLGQRFGQARLTLRMARTFVNLYFRRHGHRDGAHGYLLAMFSSFYQLVEQAKVLEQHWSWRDVPSELTPPDRAPLPRQVSEKAR
jgi:glycosyltransferase involved in cell wall biosynthesis